jgi:hypothetical protein
MEPGSGKPCNYISKLRLHVRHRSKFTALLVLPKQSNTHQILESHLNVPSTRIVSNTLMISTGYLKDVEVQSLRSSHGSLEAHVALLNHPPFCYRSFEL